MNPFTTSRKTPACSTLGDLFALTALFGSIAQAQTGPAEFAG